MSENIRIQDDGKEDPDEKNVIDERYHELECSAKQEAEAAAAAQKLNRTGAADAKTQAEGCNEEEAAASEAQAEAAVAAQQLEEAEAAIEKMQAEGSTEDEAARRRSGDAKSAAAKEETTSAGGVTRSQDNMTEKADEQQLKEVSKRIKKVHQ